METIFKVGMEVYDSLNFPDMKGVVKNIEKDCMGFWFVDVKFDKFVQSYTLQGSLSASNRPTLSTKPYKAILEDFEQKAPVPTFEEAWTEAERIYEPKSEYDKDEYKGYPSQELADAAEALRRLLFLRDYYNGDWKPDWDNPYQKKFCIINFLEEIDLIDYDEKSKFEENKFYHILAFGTEEIRDKFLEEQKELLEIAKPLL